MRFQGLTGIAFLLCAIMCDCRTTRTGGRRPQEGGFEVLATLARNPVAVDVHRDDDAGMPQLLLDVTRALVGHQQDRGIGVS